MIWPRSLEALSRSEDVPMTSTVSPTLPTASVRSTRCRAPTTTVDVPGFGDREALQLGAHGVGADADGQELIVAIGIGHRGGR